jgi:hypothetical protein
MMTEISLEERFRSLEARIDSQSGSRPPNSVGFDWKTFLTITVPILVSLMIGATLGYFGVKMTLEVTRNEVKQNHANILRVEKSLDAIEDRLRQVEINQAKASGAKSP